MALAEKSVGGSIVVTETDLRQAHREMYEERMDVRRLLADDPARAGQLRQSALAGTPFELLVHGESTDDQAWIDRGMVRDVTPGHPYFDHVRELRPGDLSEVFEHEGRFVLLKVTDRHAGRAAPPLEDIRDELTRRLRQRKMAARIHAWVEKLKAESHIEVGAL